MRIDLRLFAVIALVASWTIPLPARADGNSAISSSILVPANAALRTRDATVGQAVPEGQPKPPNAKASLPRGLSYMVELSSAWPMGNTGNPNAKLPGGVDGLIGYGFNRNIRAQASYYQFQEYPIGFNQGVVPVYLQGLSAPIATTDLGKPPQDVTIKNELIILNLQMLFQIGKLPIVITPSYVARRGQVGRHSDETQVEINGFPQTVRLRTFEQQLIAVTLPFLSTPKMFGTYTIAPQWLVNTNGANRENHPQLFQLLYLEYRPFKGTTVFFQPSILQNYTPIDYYSNHIPTFLYGFSQKTSKYTFLQLVASTGAPTNPISTQRYGILSVTCQQLPCATANQVAPQIGGLHASQIQVMFGVGTPSVVPL